MRLKSFTAKNTKEAMQMVRDELGEDAVIVATREERNAAGGMMVHMTAAVEKDMNYGGNTAYSDAPMRAEETPDENWLYEDDDNEAMVIEEVTENLLRHTVPEEVLEQIVSCASVLGIDEPRLAMLASIEQLFRFNPLPANAPFKKPIILVGQPGAGKTLAAAKLAARGAMNGLNVAMITTDTERAGGVEQLKAFTTLMDIDLQVAKDIPTLKEILLQKSDADQIIIDTAGTNPFDTQSVKELAQLIGASDLEAILVMPTNIHADEAGEVAQIFNNIGARRLLATRIDVSRRLGSLLSATYKGNLSFCDVSGTARVADGLSQLTAKRLTQLLMPRVQTARMAKEKKAG